MLFFSLKKSCIYSFHFVFRGENVWTNEAEQNVPKLIIEDGKKSERSVVNISRGSVCIVHYCGRVPFRPVCERLAKSAAGARRPAALLCSHFHKERLSGGIPVRATWSTTRHLAGFGLKLRDSRGLALSNRPPLNFRGGGKHKRWGCEVSEGEKKNKTGITLRVCSVLLSPWLSECVSGFSAESHPQPAGLVWCESKSDFIRTDLNVCVIGSEATAALYLLQ